MQQKITQKYKSSLIQNTTDAKTKAKRKLIGSVTLLLFALVVLLNVTSKIKPIPVSPQIISFKQQKKDVIKASNTIVKPTTYNNTIATTAPKDVNTNILRPSAANITTANTNLNNPNPQKQDIKEQTERTNVNKLYFKPRLVTSSITKNPGPEDILNGETSPITVTRYYVHIATSSDKNVLKLLQDELLEYDIATKLQQINAPDKIIYRLRAGPFSAKQSATDTLQNLANNMNDITINATTTIKDSTAKNNNLYRNNNTASATENRNTSGDNYEENDSDTNE